MKISIFDSENRLSRFNLWRDNNYFTIWSNPRRVFKLVKEIIWFWSIHIYRLIIEHETCVYSHICTNITDPGDPWWVKLSWWHSILKIVFSDDIELTTHEKSLLQKCLNLIHHRFPSVFHQQNYMTSNNTTTKTINEQGNLSNTQNRVIRKEYDRLNMIVLKYTIFELKI